MYISAESLEKHIRWCKLHGAQHVWLTEPNNKEGQDKVIRTQTSFILVYQRLLYRTIFSVWKLLYRETKTVYISLHLR